MTWYAVLYVDIFDEDNDYEIDCGILGIFDNVVDAFKMLSDNYDKYDKVKIESW